MILDPYFFPKMVGRAMEKTDARQRYNGQYYWDLTVYIALVSSSCGRTQRRNTKFLSIKESINVCGAFGWA